MKKAFALILSAIVLFGSVACDTTGDDPVTTPAPGASTTEKPGETETTKEEGTDEETDEETTEGTETSDGFYISGPGEMPIVKEAYTIRIMQPANPNVSDYKDNKLTHYIEETTGVTLEWDLIPEQDATTRINLVLATLEGLPDVFLGNGMTNDLVVDHAEQGTFVAVDEYVENDAFWYNEVLEKEPHFNALMKLPDGKQYSMPRNVNTRPNQTSARAWINHVWLENLNLEMPTTTEELYEVLVKFRDEDANGNGDPNDEVPFIGASVTGWQTSPEIFLMNSFIQYNRGNKYYLEDQVVQAAYDKDEFRDGLRYLHRLNAEGLFDGSSFSNDVSVATQLFANEEIALVGFIPGGGTFIFSPMDGDRVKEYSPLEPLEGPDGVRLSYYNPYDNLALNHWVITNRCEQPKVAWKVADFMYSKEVAMWNRLGEPEVDWIVPEPGTKAVDGGEALYEPILLWGSVQNSHWNEQGPGYNDFDNSGVKQDDPYELQQYLWNTMENYYWPHIPPAEDCVNPTLFYSLEDAREIQDIDATLNDYVNQAIARFATGALDPDNDDHWNEHLSNLENMNYKRRIEIMQERHDQFFADMGN